MLDLGKASLYLGMSIEREKSSIRLSQAQYIQTVLERLKMHETNSVSTPPDPKVCLLKRRDSVDDDE